MIPLIVDGHLDLAYNALRGRDLTRPAATLPADAEGIPSVSLPDLRAGGVRLVCGTIFCEPSSRDAIHGYHNAEEAHEQGWRQLQWYHAQSASGAMRVVKSAGDLPAPDDTAGTTGGAKAPAAPAPVHCILLMEGADPIGSPRELRQWFDGGVRIIGLAWKRTRYAGGTGEPGPLTVEGVALIGAMDQLGMIHDVSHLAEEAFWELLDRSGGPVIASHSNCRAIIPTDRQLTDAMIRAIVERGGVIGVNFYDRFLLPPDSYGRRPAQLADVIRQIRHVCDVSGSAASIGLGTDMDGGFGQEHLPTEIRFSSDLPRVGEALAQAKFSEGDIRAVLGGNWLEYFRRHLAG
jgi:membrane dipeptidase